MKIRKFLGWFMGIALGIALVFLVVCILGVLILPTPDIVLVKVLGLAFLLGLSAAGGLILIRILTIHVRQGDILVEKEKKKVEVIFEEEKNFWKWELKGYDIFFPYTPSARMEVHPITANPKVRQITYNVGTKLSNSIAGAQLFYDFQKEKKGWFEQNKYLKRILFNFNEERSKDMAEFYNPLELTQQEKFRALVSEYLNPKLASVGLEVKEANFSLN